MDRREFSWEDRFGLRELNRLLPELCNWMDGRTICWEEQFGFSGTKPVVARTLQLDGWTRIFLGGPAWVMGTKPVV